MTDDAELLRQYADDGSESAFGGFVAQHIDFVYAAALRQLGGDAHRAADVSQYVFIQAARRANALARHRTVKGWLYLTAKHASANAVRAERRRAAHEAEAQAVNEHPTPDATPDDLRHAVEHGLAALNEREREAVFLRFFENHDFAAIGRRHAISADAARRRIERALEKMRRVLARRGVGSTTSALAGALTAQASMAAPPGLAATAARMAVAGAATGPTALTFIAFMSVPKTQVGVLCAILLLAGIGIAVHQRFHAAHRNESTAIQPVPGIAPRPSPQPAGMPPMRVLPPPISSTEPMLAAADWTNRGQQTPTDALRTFYWATRAFDLGTLGKLISFTAADEAKAQALFAQIPPEARTKLQTSTPEELFALAWAFDNQRRVGALQLGTVSEMDADNTDIQFVVQRADHGNRLDPRAMLFQREGDGWKWAVPAAEAAHTFGDVQKQLLDKLLAP